MVAQEPGAGGELVRNGLVTLHVAAPGNAAVDGDAEAPGGQGEIPAPASTASGQADVARAEAPSAPARRRKPGLARHAVRVFDPPPAPVLPERGPVGEAPTVVQDHPAQTWGSGSLDEIYAPDGGELDEGVLGERDEEEASREEFVVHMDDVLAGRAGGLSWWRRVYPRRRTTGTLGGGRGVHVWLAEHPWLVKTVGAALAVWLVVGVASALDGHHARAPIASVIPVSERPAGTHMAGAHNPGFARSSRTARAAARPPRVHTPVKHSGVPRRRPAPALERGAAVQAPLAPRPAFPARMSAPPPPPARAPEQTQGGLFSP